MEKVEKQVTKIKQIIGCVLILTMVLLNLILSIKCFQVGDCSFVDNFGWGFLNGMIIVFGMTMLEG